MTHNSPHAWIGNPLMKPRAIVWDLFGDHLRYIDDGRVPMRVLNQLLDMFGVGESTTRVVLSRMRREGWFTTSRDGRQTSYALTGRSVRMLDEGRALCEAFGLDPLGTIASGSLLLAVDPADAEGVIVACRGAGIACAAIGRVTPASEGVSLVSAGLARPLTSFPQDEISKVFSDS